jgi:hypothetical protein
MIIFDSSLNIISSTTVQLIVVVSWSQLIHYLILPAPLLQTTVQLMMVDWCHVRIWFVIKYHQQYFH